MYTEFHLNGEMPDSLKILIIFIKILIGHQVSYRWRRFWQQVEVVSSPPSTSGMSSSEGLNHVVFIGKKDRAGEGMQENLVSWSEWTLQRIRSFLGSVAEGCQLPVSCQRVAKKQPAAPSVTPMQALSPLWDAGGWCSFQRGCCWMSIHQPQLPEQLYTRVIVIIDNYHHFRVVTEMCWALGQTLVLVSLQRGKQCRSAVWCDIRVSRNDQAF